MRWNVTDPLDTRRLERSIRIKPARYRPLDDGLFLLVEQRDQLALGADEAVNLAVGVTQEAHDGGLFIGRRQQNWHIKK